MQVSAPGPQQRTILIDGERLLGHRQALARGDAAEPVRTAFAAAHVVMHDGYADVEHSLERPGSTDEIAAWIDWRATLALRARLDALGFGIAEAMDTAQRFSLGWANAERLIRECGRLQLKHGFIAGAGVDHLGEIRGKTQLIDGVVHQARTIAEAGGMVILLPLAWLPRNGIGEAGYVEVYESIIGQLDGPLFLHWLGEMFVAELRGYFPEAPWLLLEAEV